MPKLATCDLNEKCKEQPARCFDYMMQHIVMFPRLEVVLLEIQHF